MRADAAWATPGFSGAAPSGPRSHAGDTTLAAPSAAPCRVLSQALSNAALAGARSLPGRLRTPRTADACKGPSARKTLRGPRRSKGSRTRTIVWSLPVLVLVWVACASPRKAKGFFGLPSRTHQLCEGCGGGGMKNAAGRRVFQGLQRRFNAAEGALSRRRSSPSPDTGAP